jgi:signal peptidase II|tara:strand:- start:246 stop:722 length:477 start_codon:yes stop_codon:yes gene_type:complete
MKKKIFWNFFFILIIFLLDRVTKISIINFLENSDNGHIQITNFLSFNLIWNEGIAFGLFSFDQELYYNFLTIIIILVTTIILWMIIKTKGLEKIAFLMIFGGSLGNIFDRLVYSSVPDFIDLHYNNFNWFIFNVADIFISIGIILLIYLEFFKKKINE